MQEANSPESSDFIGLPVKIGGVRVAGVFSCVPKQVILNDHYESIFGVTAVADVVNMIGVHQRRLAPLGVTGGDLTFIAAEKLLGALDWSPQSVDAIIYVSQTPDYKLPATACILQKRLGLNKQCAAFDMNLGCSAYPYALWIGMSLLKAGSLSRILVCVTETMSKIMDENDRATAMLFGDAATVTALELDPKQSATHFLLGTDGSGAANLIVADGSRGALEPIIEEKKISNPDKLYMDGWEVFGFTIAAVPRLIRDSLGFADLKMEDVDYFLLHQANAFMLDHLIKKSKLPANRVPRNIQFFGNTSCASIPLLMSTELRDKLKDKNLKLLLVGFGVGYSWASAIIDVDANFILGLTEI